MLPDLFKRQMFLVVSQSSGYYDKQTYNSLTPKLSALDGHLIAFTQNTFSINILYRIYFYFVNKMMTSNDNRQTHTNLLQIVNTNV